MPPLVGREGEQAVLRDAFAAARAGHGTLALVGGAAGIGKTTLVESLCREAAGAGAAILTRRCYELGGTPPYRPWIEIFAAAPEESRMPLPATFAQPGRLGEVGSQSALFQQVRDFLAGLTASRPEGTRPVVLLLDDLHWADSASLDLLRFLARAVAALPLLLIGTYRSDELTRRLPSTPSRPCWCASRWLSASPSGRSGTRRCASCSPRATPSATRTGIGSRFICKRAPKGTRSSSQNCCGRSKRRASFTYPATDGRSRT